MLESLSTNTLDYQKLSLEEQQKRGILGRLTGVIADYVNPTRNGRRYSEKLWENVFSDPIVQEKIKNRCMFGELGHPADRSEVDMEKIALCLAEVPKKGKDGCLYGVFDILDTPNGRILKCLCDYGCNIGVSSRGEGDLITGYDGQEDVDPDSYTLECWDAVLVPSVMKARQSYVTEGLTNKTKLWESLNTIIDSSNEDDKKVIKESLSLLDLNDYSQDENLVNNNEVENNLAVENNQATGESLLLQQLQESLKQQELLRNENSELREQLSVSYTKETKQQEEIEKYKKSISKLLEARSKDKINSKLVETLKNNLDSSKESNKQNAAKITDLQTQLNESKTKLVSDGKLYKKQISNLNETITNLRSIISEDKSKLESLEQENNSKVAKLQESMQTKEKDAQMKIKELEGKLSKQKGLTEKYQRIAVKAVDKYIESKALALGISVNEIKNKLSESYTFTEIDEVCEDLRQYKLNLNKLPFNSTGLAKQLVESTKVKTRSTDKSLLPKDKVHDGVDEVDDQLLSLANLY